MRSGVRTPAVLALASVLVSALLLAACAWTRPVTAGDSVPHRLTDATATQRLAQLDFGRAARFATCVDAGCPRKTHKTLAVIAPAAPAAAPVAESAAASPPPDPAAAQPDVPTQAPLPHRVVLHFASNSASLSPSHKAVLANALRDLHKTERIVIVGRTDDIGSEAVNQSLAFARALAIRDHLLDLAPDLPARIAIDAKGRCCYAAANDAADGRSRNRRAELVFTTPAEAAP